MGKPRKVGLDYFPHDAHAWTSLGMEVLRAKFGNTGYACYWICAEYTAQQESLELELNESTTAILAARAEVSPERLMDILTYCAEPAGVIDFVRFKEDRRLVFRCVTVAGELVEEKRERYKRLRPPKGARVSEADKPQRKPKESKAKEREVEQTTGEETISNQQTKARVTGFPPDLEKVPASEPHHRLADLLKMDGLVTCEEGDLEFLTRVFAAHINRSFRTSSKQETEDAEEKARDLCSGIRLLLCLGDAEERERILMEAQNGLDGQRNWPLYVAWWIQYAVLMSKRSEILNVIGYVRNSLGYPARLASERKDGELSKTSYWGILKDLCTAF